MARYRVTYFDFSGSRGEEVRLALAVAGVDFEDNRISRKTFETMKPELPYARLPMLEIEHEGVLAQSNAILRLIGRRHGLYPEDIFRAARHDSVMEAAEDLRNTIVPTLRIKDETEKLAIRRDIAENYIPEWAGGIERQITGPFVEGEKVNVADIKLYMLHRWISGGNIDGIPADVFRPHEKLDLLAASVAAHPVVHARYS